MQNNKKNKYTQPKNDLTTKLMKALEEISKRGQAADQKTTPEDKQAIQKFNALIEQVITTDQLIETKAKKEITRYCELTTKDGNTFYAAIEWKYVFTDVTILLERTKKSENTEKIKATLIITLDNPFDNVRSDQNGPREPHLNYEFNVDNIESKNHNFLNGHIIIDRFIDYAMLPSRDLAETLNGGKGKAITKVPFESRNKIIDLMQENPANININLNKEVKSSHYYVLQKLWGEKQKN